jgi:hypothetical protein
VHFKRPFAVSADDAAASLSRSAGLKATQRARYIGGLLPADVVEVGLEPSLRCVTPEVPQLEKKTPVGIALACMVADQTLPIRRPFRAANIHALA